LAGRYVAYVLERRRGPKMGDKLRLRFKGWSAAEDEWVPIPSDRVRIRQHVAPRQMEREREICAQLVEQYVETPRMDAKACDWAPVT
jgi:hypothetical protein